MNKPKAQGTAWESEFVRRAQEFGLMADRLPEGGATDAGDVWIGDTPSGSNDVYPHNDISIVAWSRLINNGKVRRVPDGVRSVVVIATDDFLTLARIAFDHTNVAFTVECKATERLNVTRELDKAKRKLALWKARA